MAQALSRLGVGVSRGKKKPVPAYLCGPITCSSGKEASPVSDGESQVSPSRERSGVIFFFRPVNRKDIKVPFGKVACSILQRGCNSPPSQPLPVLLVFISRREKINGLHPRETHLRGSICEGHDSGHLETRRSQRKGRSMRNMSCGSGSEESADSPLSPNPSVYCQHREAPML